MINAYEAVGWYDNWQGKPKYSEKSYPIATLSTTWPDVGRRGGKPVTILLNFDFDFECQLASGHEKQMGLDTKTDWPTDRRS
jgi:hypothetical protein